MKKVMIVIMVALSQTSWAYEADMSSVSPTVTCKHTTGYGNYEGHGQTAHEARSAATKACANDLIDQFERSRGYLPSAEQAEDMILSCVNICP